MRAMGVIGSLGSQLGRYPPEALESLCHSVRGDALDARRARRPLARARVSLLAWPGLAGDTWWFVRALANGAHGAGTRWVL